jgi:hypothetical protein
MPAANGPAAVEPRMFPRRNPPRPRPRPRPWPRLRRACRLASSAFLCSCILICSSAMRARSVSLRRTPLGLNFVAADAPRPDDAGAGVLLGSLEGADEPAAEPVVDSEGTVMIGIGAGPGAVVTLGAAVAVSVAGLGSAVSGVCTTSGAAAAAAAPRAVPPRPRPRPRPRVVAFGGI